MGLEPTIFRFVAGRLIHWATRPVNHMLILAFINIKLRCANEIFTHQISLNYRPRCKYIRLNFNVTM